jgi:OOP family OmpA-OmpF porin
MSRKIELTVCVVALLFCLAGSAFSVTTGQKVEFEGWIVSRQGESLTVSTVEKGDINVLVTSYTKVQEPRGLFKIRKTQRPLSNLLPGLRIKVKGIGNTQSQVLAESIRFSGDDLRTAYALKAGLIPLQNQVGANTQQIAVNQASIQSNQQQIAANQAGIQSGRQQIASLERRFSNLTNYLVRYTTFVYFPAGSSTLSVTAQDDLRRLAREAQSLDGYFIQVKGHTDSSGTASFNQGLSMRRAQSVMAYLQDTGNIPLTRMLTPAAMGEARPVSSNSTPQGRAGNRRVEVNILVNHGLAGEQLIANTK